LTQVSVFSHRRFSFRAGPALLPFTTGRVFFFPMWGSFPSPPLSGDFPAVGCRFLFPRLGPVLGRAGFFFISSAFLLHVSRSARLHLGPVARGFFLDFFFPSFFLEFFPETSDFFSLPRSGGRLARVFGIGSVVDFSYPLTSPFIPA